MNDILKHAHEFLAEVITPDDVVVDATMGNGHDTEFLARLSRNVFAFDIQEAALTATRNRLDKSGLSATLIKNGHEAVDEHVSGPVKAAIFNLGFLPGSKESKRVITMPHTTVTALEKLSGMLVSGGRIAITVYPGHVGGSAEESAVLKFVGRLDVNKWQIARCDSQHRMNYSPFLLCIQKL